MTRGIQRCLYGSGYCRAVSTVHTGNGKKKGEGNGKCGNRYLACAFWALICQQIGTRTSSAPV